MIIKSPDDGTEQSRALLRSVMSEVTELREELKKLKEQLSTGEEINETDAKAKLQRLKDAVAVCHKVESQLADCTRKHGTSGAVLDLSAAREEVRCRLDRLARRCGP